MNYSTPVRGRPIKCAAHHHPSVCTTGYLHNVNHHQAEAYQALCSLMQGEYVSSSMPSSVSRLVVAERVTASIRCLKPCVVFTQCLVRDVRLFRCVRFRLDFWPPFLHLLRTPGPHHPRKMDAFENATFGTELRRSWE